MATGLGATVAGGGWSISSAESSAVGGGLFNTADGDYAVVPGGAENSASGQGSFAAGWGAVAEDNGAFVWADLDDPALRYFVSSAVNEFSARARGGFRFVTDIDAVGIPTEGLSVLASSNTLSAIGTGAMELHVGSARAFRLEPHFGGANIIGGSSDNSITTGVICATISGGGYTTVGNIVTDDGGTISGGCGNVAGNSDATFDNAPNATVSGGSLNIAAGDSSTIGGGYTNNAVEWGSTVSGGWGNFAGGGPFGTIGGGAQNTASAQGATVSGGGDNLADGINATIGGGTTNTASGGGATVGGGTLNAVSGLDATVGGGNSNTSSGADATVGGGISNEASEYAATVAGGDGNIASNGYSTIGGGLENIASNSSSTVGGGSFNEASGDSATIPGGVWNIADGLCSLAAGFIAQANHEGAFVWADSDQIDIRPFTSTAINEFSVRARGGFRFVTDMDATGVPTEGLSILTSSNTLSAIGTGPMVLQATGGVGIGTTTPLEQLEVANNVRVDGVLYSNSYNAFLCGTTENGKPVAVQAGRAGGGLGSSMNANAPAANRNGGNLTLAAGGAGHFAKGGDVIITAGDTFDTGSQGGSVLVKAQGYTNTGTPGHIAFFTGGSYPMQLENPIERMRVASNGCVGIGKSNPGSTLDVAGTVTTNSQFVSTVVASAPLVVASTTQVTNLNADMVDDQHAASFATSGHNHDTSYWKLGGNAGTTPGTDFLGTTDDVALEFKVNGQRALRLEPNADSPNIIGGYSGNSVTSGVVGASISGGGTSGGKENIITDNYGTISGGHSNVAGDNDADLWDSNFPTVGGGFGNYASGSFSTVAGGWCNLAANSYSTVGGGYANNASGAFATISGGWQNQALGSYSFAAGCAANANHDGSFVWSDSTGGATASSAVNQFVARASGGTWFYSDSGATTGVNLASGSGSWTTLSDVNLKENFVQTDSEDILTKISVIPVSTWNYKAQDASIRHMGPTAQDFKAVFGLGETDKGISSVDIDGVNIAAIKALAQRTTELKAANEALQKENDELKARLAAIEAKLGISSIK